MTDSAEICILCEDQARMGFRDRIFMGQHGLSLFVRAEKDVLFDTGPSNVFRHNAELLGIDPDRADHVVLSHGHWDHTDGILHLSPDGDPRNLVAHPGIFANRHKQTGEYNGIGASRKDLEKRFNLHLVREPLALTESLFFLGEIPRDNDFESVNTTFFLENNGEKQPDFLMDDSALALATSKGCVVISGCAHAGICNTCEYAKKVTGQSHLHMVLGGFHLLDEGEQLERTVSYFKENPVDRLFPMHCTALPALSRFYQEFGAPKLCCGDVVRV
jgi:7,8-dihydropterin-6-yl-methyl-4-(beta-D-ribofuranosyl)aminobenzene 5'-phosphate synthase